MIKLRKVKYNLCIDFTGKYSTALLALFGGFKYSSGLNYNGFGFCYTGFVNTDTQTIKGLLSEKYLLTLKEGLEIIEPECDGPIRNFYENCEIHISEKDAEQAESKLRSLELDPDKPSICIQVTAGWDAKEWIENNYSELIEKILKADKSFLLIGSKEDSEKNFRILDKISPDLRKYYLSIPLKVNAAVIRLSDVFIGNDSIGLHLAGAVGTPSIGLFGPTNPGFSNPSGESHKVLYKKLRSSAV